MFPYKYVRYPISRNGKIVRRKQMAFTISASLDIRRAIHSAFTETFLLGGHISYSGE